jgi:hypothetical protein
MSTSGAKLLFRSGPYCLFFPPFACGLATLLHRNVLRIPQLDAVMPKTSLKKKFLHSYHR